MNRIVTLRGVILLAALAALAGPLHADEANGFDAAHRVAFRSGATPANKLNFNEPHDRIGGYLYKPPGNGPFAAVVLEPDLAGLRPLQHEWAERLVQWGYVALAVDLLREGQGKSSALIAAHDAYGALKQLAGLPFVDARRIVWIGWSHHGGQAMLGSGGMDADPRNPAQPMPWLVSEGPWRFRAAVAFYPECPGVKRTYYAPMLVLIGGADARHLPLCKASAALSTAGGRPVRMVVYPGATHGFDLPGVKLDVMADPARYDAAAARDTVAQVRAFLAEQLDGAAPR